MTLIAAVPQAALSRPAAQQGVCGVIEASAARYEAQAAAVASSSGAAGPEAALAALRSERTQAVLSLLSKPDRRFSDWEVQVVRQERHSLRYAGASIPAMDVVVSLQCRTPAVFEARSITTPELVSQFRALHPGEVVVVSGFILPEAELPASDAEPPPFQDVRFRVQFISLVPLPH